MKNKLNENEWKKTRLDQNGLCYWAGERKNHFKSNAHFCSRFFHSLRIFSSSNSYYYLNVAWRLRLCRWDASFFLFFQHIRTPVLGCSILNYIQIEFAEELWMFQKVCCLPSVNKLHCNTRSPILPSIFLCFLSHVVLLISWLIWAFGEQTIR